MTSQLICSLRLVKAALIDLPLFFFLERRNPIHFSDNYTKQLGLIRNQHFLIFRLLSERNCLNTYSRRVEHE